MFKPSATACAVKLLALASLAAPVAVWAADAAPTAPVASNLTVVRDAETGQLRAPNAAELAVLERRQSESAAAGSLTGVVPQQKLGATGARGLRLTDSLVSYAVAVRRPDGKLQEQCFSSQDAAEAAAKADHRAVAPAKTAASMLETE